jgi:hypothetical protein
MAMNVLAKPGLRRSLVALGLSWVATQGQAQFCAEGTTPLTSLGAPAGCDRCENTRIPGQTITAGAQSVTTLISDLPEAFCSNGVLYSTMPVLPPDQNGSPSLALRTQSSNGGFDFVRGDFDVFLFHLIPGTCSPVISDKRVVIYVKNDGTGPITVNAKQIIITDGTIGTIHQMESTLGSRELSENWDTNSLSSQTIPAGQGAVVAYSKRFRSTSNTSDRSTNINCFGRVRGAVSNGNSVTSPTQMHVSVIALDGTVALNASAMRTAAEALLGQAALSGESAIDLNTAPSGCQTRRAVGTYDTFLWNTPAGSLTMDAAASTTRTFQMALWQLASGGCPTGQQSVTMRRHPGFTRPDTIGNYHVDYRVNLRLVNKSTVSSSTMDITFGKADADVGLGWQVTTTPGGSAFPTTATLLAAPVRTGWAGPNQTNRTRSFLASDGGPIALGPCEARNVSLRFMVLGNSSLPYQIHVVPLTPPADIVVDNEDAESTRTTGWGNSSNPGFWNTNSLIASTGGSVEVNSWRATLPQAGFYNVYAWWVASSNRSTASPYRLHTLNGPVIVPMNQRINSAQWMLLGSFPFQAGSAWVDVSDTGLLSGEFVSADAVRFVYTGPVPVNLRSFEVD